MGEAYKTNFQLLDFSKLQNNIHVYILIEYQVHIRQAAKSVASVKYE